MLSAWSNTGRSAQVDPADGERFRTETRRPCSRYCGALGKRANCQVGVRVHAVIDRASCPLEWELFLPEEWAHDDGRRRRVGISSDVEHASKTRLALGLLNRLTGQGLAVPVIVGDAGYGGSVSFRLALGNAAGSTSWRSTPEIAQPADAEPHHPSMADSDHRRCHQRPWLGPYFAPAFTGFDQHRDPLHQRMGRFECARMSSQRGLRV
ncbi:transposase [Streptomyces sp. NPDC052013]|uniref:transposase n=1 Tax=Streptomyces sp. NPDC052013 TaxID=3365679 RepID=UPI0037D55DE1